MSSVISSLNKSFVASEAIGAFVAVKKVGTTDTIAKAGIGDKVIGFTMANIASGDSVAVALLNSGGTAFLKVSGAIAKNATVRIDANGLGTDAGTGPIVGSAESSASGANSIIEVLVRDPGTAVEVGAAQAAVVAASTNGTAGAAADLNALKAEAENIGDDVRAVIALANALRTALLNKGIIKGAA